MTITIRDDVDASIVVSFAEPSLNKLVGDTLRVMAGVKSAAALATVVATVGSRSVTLKITPVGGLGLVALWGGVIDITDLPTGAYQVTVTATDAKGARGIGVIQFQRDTRTGKGGSSDAPKVK